MDIITYLSLSIFKAEHLDTINMLFSPDEIAQAIQDKLIIVIDQIVYRNLQ